MLRGVSPPPLEPRLLDRSPEGRPPEFVEDADNDGADGECRTWGTRNGDALNHGATAPRGPAATRFGVSGAVAGQDVPGDICGLHGDSARWGVVLMA
mmetsp:Transcript_79876/g.203371  ORF Transcript_79876/g.203371 Transcript_79876/m.203371 type:complete len:97 (-) Transcript_79876:1314-1604(-)